MIDDSGDSEGNSVEDDGEKHEERRAWGGKGGKGRETGEKGKGGGKGKGKRAAGGRRRGGAERGWWWWGWWWWGEGAVCSKGRWQEAAAVKVGGSNQVFFNSLIEAIQMQLLPTRMMLPG